MEMATLSRKVNAIMAYYFLIYCSLGGVSTMKVGE